MRQSTANERYVKRQVYVIRVYTCSERHLTFRRNIDTRRQWSVGNRGIGWNEWLYWEIVINDHCPGSVVDWCIISDLITDLVPTLFGCFTCINSSLTLLSHPVSTFLCSFSACLFPIKYVFLPLFLCDKPEVILPRTPSVALLREVAKS